MIRWELFMPDGRVVEGRGQNAPEGMKLSELAAEAIAGRYQHPAGTTVYVAGKTDLLWTVQHVIAAGPDARAHGLPPVSKALGLTPACASCRVWMMPNGDIGIGRSVEEVATAYKSFAQARP